ncbi:hypothetical protein V496_00840 [Pseudogymnoascus sp. VKM F-4515 (FW-2607)]|nr:hypothetical protein V496_00840 [Pseudogymnoascus sp. VKM F-4515 (FW-2607)]KFY82678.1 hypothetical protein V498_08508 [Pseudogymnoascus sp. VKM F-4517 (FW-2822)]
MTTYFPHSTLHQYLKDEDEAMTTQLEERFSTASSAMYSYICPDVDYHGPTDDVLSCDGICHTPRPLCLVELERVVADYTARVVASSTPSTQIWLRMARAALHGPDNDGWNGSAPGEDAESWAWSTPEGANLAMTGADFSPTTKSHLAMTGLRADRVANLATAGLSGLVYLAHHRPEDIEGPTRAVCAWYNGLPYADELSASDQGGEWSHLSNLAGPLLGAERLLSGPLPELFDRVLFSYHCCTVRPRPPSTLTIPSIRTLFLARFYDSTLPSFLDCFKCLEPGSVLLARASHWGTLLSNDVFDYISDGLSGRAANLCWAIGSWESPVECARMFRGCLIAVAQAAHNTPGPLFVLVYMVFLYLYTARYCYYSVPYVPTPGVTPVSGFRAALRAAFSAPSDSVREASSELFDTDSTINGGPQSASASLPPWQGIPATPCSLDNASGDDFDVVAARGTHEILGCLDRTVYLHSPGLYYAHLGWLVRQYDALIVASRDNLGVGRYYMTHRVT